MTTAVTTTSAATTTAATTSATSATTDTATTTASTSATGLSTASSISSASTTDAAAGPSFYERVQEAVTNVINAIRDCFAKLPLIGYLFARGAETSATGSTTSATGSSTQLTDAEILDLIQGQFVAAGAGTATGTGTATATGSTSAPAAVDEEVLNYLVTSFQQIQDQGVKVQAFQTVHASANATDAHRKRFFDALPEGDHAVAANPTELTKQALKHHVWAANGNSSVAPDGTDHGLNYGEWFFNNITPQVLTDALHHLRHVVTAAGSSSATSATSATGSTSATGTGTGTTTASATGTTGTGTGP